jgi:hypothetical protein
MKHESFNVASTQRDLSNCGCISISYGLFFVCIGGKHRYIILMYAHICIPMPFKTRNWIQQIQTKYKRIKNIVSRPEFHILCNCTFFSAVGPILCRAKWIQLFAETVIAFNLHFQHIYRTQVIRKPIRFEFEPTSQTNLQFQQFYFSFPLHL